MKIAVMCGGRGTRLKSLTQKVPKPLTVINGKTVLGLKIDQYIKQGYNDYIFCVGYKGDMIREYINTEYKQINATFSDSGVESGILARLYNARKYFSEKILMTYGDTISKINISDFVSAHNRSRNKLTITLAQIKSPFGIVKINDNKQVKSFKEKPIFNYFIGYAIINSYVLEEIPKTFINSADAKGIISLFDYMIKKNSIGAYLYAGHKLTFNTKEELDIARNEIKNYYTVVE